MMVACVEEAPKRSVSQSIQHYGFDLQLLATEIFNSRDVEARARVCAEKLNRGHK